MRTGFIYELKSKDKSVTGTYIGSCWDMKRRLTDHKDKCNNKKRKKYNYPVYRYIREHGGFDNFEMTIIDSGECEDTRELECGEQFYIDMSGGIENLLNGKDALMDKQKRIEKKYENKQRNKDTKRFYCEPCDYAAESEYARELHYTSNKHKKNILKYI